MESGQAGWNQDRRECLSRQWLDAIPDHIAKSLRIDVDDFDEVPFNTIGGLGRVHDLFGERLPGILEELNGTLAA